MCESDDGGGQVVGDGMVEKAPYVKQGDLPGGEDGVHALMLGAEEPARQESERP